MDEQHAIHDSQGYNTDINIIGGIRDTSIIHKTVDAYLTKGDFKENDLQIREELGVRTERSQERIDRAIRRNFLEFFSVNHRELTLSIHSHYEALPDKDLLIFWQFALMNRLFREISVNVFSRYYFSGRVGISKDEVIGYLKELLLRNKHLDIHWSESTIQTLSTKYLNLMTNLNLLEGARNKSFKQIRIRNESLVLFLYFAEILEPQNKNILKNEMRSLSFIPNEDLLSRLKKLSIKGFFEMNFNGVELNILLPTSYRGICDVLCR